MYYLKWCLGFLKKKISRENSLVQILKVYKERNMDLFFIYINHFNIMKKVKIYIMQLERFYLPFLVDISGLLGTCSCFTRTYTTGNKYI